MKKLAILVSSLVKNIELAQQLESEVRHQGAQVEVLNLVELDLPMYTSALEDEKGIPLEVQDLTYKLAACDGFIMVAPEYNGSMPPVLSNTIAWVSRTGDDFRAVFNQKFIALATHSGGGGHKVMEAMRSMFAYLGANVLSREIITNFSKPYNEKTGKKVVEELLKYA